MIKFHMIQSFDCRRDMNFSHWVIFINDFEYELRISKLFCHSTLGGRVVHFRYFREKWWRIRKLLVLIFKIENSFNQNFDWEILVFFDSRSGRFLAGVGKIQISVNFWIIQSWKFHKIFLFWLWVNWGWSNTV